MHRIFAALLLLAAVPAGARADGPAPPEDRWAPRPGGPLTLDAGVVLAHPTSLGTGLSSGVGAGATWGLSRLLRVGARGSWSSSTESSIDWTVSQSDFKLRAFADLRHVAGRGAFGLRLGLGPTLVHEARSRNQAQRAQLPPSLAESSAWATFPAADLEAVVAVHVAGPWLLLTSGGPSWSLSGGRIVSGWTALIGTGWQP
jgi:hypothetical protein